MFFCRLHEHKTTEITIAVSDNWFEIFMVYLFFAKVNKYILSSALKEVNSDVLLSDFDFLVGDKKDAKSIKILRLCETKVIVL